ncbi:MAG TPA: zinc ribbon domain-containing protein [Anaerolineae bacterium]|nr:zinc ribbon domain-containing protein [Anaerolineae bacterium]HXK43864.1 zinc ribbon domain-containing protein [Anaerolineae bacterium]
MSDQMYCGQCGSANPASNKFCGKCGAALNTSQANPSNVSLVQSTLHPNACPICKSIDQIQKLSTIVTSGTRTTAGISSTLEKTDLSGSQRHYVRGTGYVADSELSGKSYSSSSTLIDATEQSNLAKRLSPPSKPQEPVLERPFWGERAEKVIDIAGIAIWLVLAGQATNRWGIIGFIAGSIGAAIVCGLLFWLISYLVFGNSQKEAEKQLEIEKGKHAKDVVAWEQAQRRWETIYYCYRDDVIFVPGENRAVTPDHLIELCYRRRTPGQPANTAH